MWIVYGAMQPSDGRNAIQGPLPRKRWIKHASDPKRHKLAYRAKFSARSSELAADYNERRAIEYARWLAERDSVEIPANASPFAVWDYTDQTTGTPAKRKRVRAVEWRNVTIHRGRESHGEALLKIEIPNWDFVPAEPIEEIIDAPSVAPSFDLAPVALPRVKVPPLFLATSRLVRVHFKRPVTPSCVIRLAA